MHVTLTSWRRSHSTKCKSKVNYLCLLNFSCSVCDLCYGSCINCSVPNCQIPFHPTCALRSGLYMTVEDNCKSKIGVKLFSFCFYHSAKAKSVKGSTNNRMEFILDQLNMGSNNTAAECYKVEMRVLQSELQFLFRNQKLASWRVVLISSSVGLKLRTIWVWRVKLWNKSTTIGWNEGNYSIKYQFKSITFRRSNHNRPLICPYEANDKFTALKFRDDNPPKPTKKPQLVNPTDQDMEEMVNEYAKAHCILDKVSVFYSWIDLLVSV
jgi:hypothetical protein